jgi:GTP-binding protein HflX
VARSGILNPSMAARSIFPLIDTKRIERLGRQERAILVGVILPRTDTTPDDPLEELRGLAKTADLNVVGEMLQKRHQVDIATYIGSGKVNELKLLVDAHEADVVVFDNDLGPAQTRNLEKKLEVKVVDRTEVILDIFATHARTHEAHLQVELAQLEYAMPRLKRMWTHLSRYKGGIGLRGPGEKQLEEDRRIVAHRIQELKAKLQKIQARKEREVASRDAVPTVSLVGYTNAGKSTLMNALTEAGVLVEDKLFATLDTRTRRWRFAGGGYALLSDTVGFIRDLPHALVASFKATLEEARQADLLLHVVDASSIEAEAQIQAVKAVLAELGLEDHPTLLVLNKTDRVPDRSYLDVLEAHHTRSVAISAARGEGLDLLERAVRNALEERSLDAFVETGVANGRVLAYLAQHGQIRERVYSDDDRVRVSCRLPMRCLEFLLEHGVDVQTGAGQRLCAS